MSRSNGLFLIFLVILLPLSACGTSGSKTRTLTANDAGKTVELNTGDTLAVELEGNPTTGYVWEVEAVDAAVLKQTGESEFKPESDATGAGGVEILRFEAVASGQTALKLVYHRPWEEDVSPEETFEVTIVVK